MSLSPQCFEGLKAYHGVDGKIRLFRPMENMMRLSRSAEAASLPVSQPMSMRGTCMPQSPCKPAHVPCKPAHVPCKPAHVPCKPAHVPCKPAQVPCKPAHVPCKPAHVPCKPAHVHERNMFVYGQSCWDK